MVDIPRIVTFAGQPVPNDGLVLHPPQGGELTVWPDGGYAFTPPDGGVPLDGLAPVTTYYSFVMEDIDGETSVGSFSLTPGDEMPGAMEDFQAWSLPDLLQGESEAFQLLLDAQADLSAVFDWSVEVAPAGQEFTGMVGGDGSITDDLTQMIIESQNS